MRLAKFFTQLSPVGVTLAAAGAVECALSEAVAEQNARLAVSATDGTGLSLWEADYGLPDGMGEHLGVWRARILAAMAGVTAPDCGAASEAVRGVDRGGPGRGGGGISRLGGDGPSGVGGKGPR